MYLAEFKARVEVIKGAGGKPGLHDAAIKLVCDERGLTLDALNASRADAAGKEMKSRKRQPVGIWLLSCSTGSAT